MARNKDFIEQLLTVFFDLVLAGWVGVLMCCYHLTSQSAFNPLVLNDAYMRHGELVSENVALRWL